MSPPYPPSWNIIHHPSVEAADRMETYVSVLHTVQQRILRADVFRASKHNIFKYNLRIAIFELGVSDHLCCTEFDI